MNQDSPPKVGPFTLKPCMRTILTLHGRPTWVPVIGPRHDDPQFLNLHFQHYHVDWRYLTGQQAQALEKSAHAAGTKVNQVVLSYAKPEGSDHIIHLNEIDRRIDQYPPKTYMKEMRRRCSREFTPYPNSRGNWLPEMEATFEDQKLIDGHICPHPVHGSVDHQP